MTNELGVEATRLRHPRSLAVRAAPVVLRAGLSCDRRALADMLSQLSARSSYLRFFAGGVRITDHVLDALLCVKITGQAFVALEADRVIAHAMWAATRADADRVDIAFVVAENRRRRGLATRLTRLALADAAGLGFGSAEATVLAENPAAQRVVRRVLPNATSTRSQGEITFVAPLVRDSATRGPTCRAPRVRRRRSLASDDLHKRF